MRAEPKSLVGTIAGDSLGSLVEFMTPDQIRVKYPRGVRELEDGGVWNTLAGQPTDDTEMALALARTLNRRGKFEVGEVFLAYETWLHSDPFDCGNTTRNGLLGTPNPDSQANGALMRVAPLGVFSVRHREAEAAMWADVDAGMTHPHRICREANALFVLAIRDAVLRGPKPRELHELILRIARERKVSEILLKSLKKSADEAPQDFMSSMGWALIAFQNAFYQLLHCGSPEEGITDTVNRGGDTDTNGAIAGALLGAVYGVEAIPRQWREAVSQCRPDASRKGVKRPRPRTYWPCDAEALAEGLVRE